MRKRQNIEIKLNGYHKDFEPDNFSGNIVFTKDGHVETRPGMTELILPYDPDVLVLPPFPPLNPPDPDPPEDPPPPTPPPWPPDPTPDDEFLLVMVENGSGTVTPATGAYLNESTDSVDISAAPTSPATFENWSGDISDLSIDPLSAAAQSFLQGEVDRIIAGNFSDGDQLILYVCKYGAGTITLEGITYHDSGDVISIDAIPQDGWYLKEVRGEGLDFTITEDSIVFVIFAPMPNPKDPLNPTDPDPPTPPIPPIPPTPWPDPPWPDPPWPDPPWPDPDPVPDPVDGDEDVIEVAAPPFFRGGTATMQMTGSSEFYVLATTDSGDMFHWENISDDSKHEEICASLGWPTGTVNFVTQHSRLEGFGTTFYQIQHSLRWYLAPSGYVYNSEKLFHNGVLQTQVAYLAEDEIYRGFVVSQANLVRPPEVDGATRVAYDGQTSFIGEPIVPDFEINLGESDRVFKKVTDKIFIDHAELEYNLGAGTQYWQSMDTDIATIDPVTGVITPDSSYDEGDVITFNVVLSDRWLASVAATWPVDQCRKWCICRVTMTVTPLTVRVDADCLNPTDGRTWETAFLTIEDAIDYYSSPVNGNSVLEIDLQIWVKGG